MAPFSSLPSSPPLQLPLHFRSLSHGLTHKYVRLALLRTHTHTHNRRGKKGREEEGGGGFRAPLKRSGGGRSHSPSLFFSPLSLLLNRLNGSKRGVGKSEVWGKTVHGGDGESVRKKMHFCDRYGSFGACSSFWECVLERRV